MKKKNEFVMRIQHPVGYSCRAKGIVVGTPEEIVKVLYETRSPFFEVSSLKKYMEKMVKRTRDFGLAKGAVLQGKTHEKRCLSFLKIMIKAGQIKELPFQKSR